METVSGLVIWGNDASLRGGSDRIALAEGEGVGATRRATDLATFFALGAFLAAFGALFLAADFFAAFGAGFVDLEAFFALFAAGRLTDFADLADLDDPDDLRAAI